MKTHVAMSRIRLYYDMFSQSEKKIADFLLTGDICVKTTTAAELAEYTNTSPATIVRFCRSLGFAGFSSFKDFVISESTRGGNLTFDEDEVEDISVIKKKTFEFNKSKLEETMLILNDSLLSEVVDTINNSSKLYLVSEGGSAGSARSVYASFLQIGIDCVLLEDPFFQVTAISRADANGVVLGISHSGKARNVVEAMKFAQEKGLKTIGLSGFVGSPLIKYSDLSLITCVSEHEYFSDSIAARICELQILSTVHTALSIINKDKLGDYKKEVSEILKMKRVEKL